ncbi:MAG: hypothetical protein ABI548_10525 [Polyangiaceae bacterium]
MRVQTGKPLSRQGGPQDVLEQRFAPLQVLSARMRRRVQAEGVLTHAQARRDQHAWTPPERHGLSTAPKLWPCGCEPADRCSSELRQHGVTLRQLLIDH